MHLCNTKFLPRFSDFELVNAQRNIDLYMNFHLLKGRFSQQSKQYFRTWSFKGQKWKQVKFDLCSVSRRTMPI